MRERRLMFMGGAAVLAAAAITIALQAVLVRRRTPRLPVAAGKKRGRVFRTAAVDLRLLVVGESSAVGVGVSTQQQGLAAQLASILGAAAVNVRWSAVGRIGATARALNQEIIDTLRVDQADIVVIALGVNDAIRLRSPLRWYRDLRQLSRTLQQCTRCRLTILSPVPPLWKFKCLPQPLRGLLGLHAFILDRTSRLLARRNRGRSLYVPISLEDQATLLAQDRFHPSQAGYAVWAQRLAHAITMRLRASSRPIAARRRAA